MTADELARQLGAGALVAPLGASSVLNLCDRIVGERCRREHRFGWLRAPGDDPEAWIAVDGYYPGNRLVVLYRERPKPHDKLCAELIPQHGLRLLILAATELGAGREHAELTLRRLIESLGPAPVRTREHGLPRRAAVDESGTPGDAVARAVASLAAPRPPTPPQTRRVGQSYAAAAERAARYIAAHKFAAVRPAPGTRMADRARSAAGTRELPIERAKRVARAAREASQATPPGRADGTLAVPVGLVLAALLGVEVYLGVTQVGLGRGLLLLAFGLALDACARALGTIAASKAGAQAWAWASALGGSPVVAGFALFRRSGPVEIDPAPLAGLIALLAMGILVVAGVTAAFGI
jgi:hypothetical protein